ncbi:MAG: cobyrinate a,c-diamide synthase [Acidimicrobiaceae bacterium]|nr:cobyrinate a,c-diamide synthase [Acidimicrobiaceae bacterium]
MTRAIIISALNSGAGKTTISSGIMAAVRERGLSIASAKVGPDYIDPTFHRIATGRPSYNIDTFLTGRKGALASVRRAAKGVDYLIIEGVMGIFDGTTLDTTKDVLNPDPPSGNWRFATGSTAEIAMILGAPIVLVLDSRGTTESLVASVIGIKKTNPSLLVAGVILNRVASEEHVTQIASALSASGILLLGAMPKESSAEVDSRHLGLVPASEDLGRATRKLASICSAVQSHVDVEKVLKLARPIPVGVPSGPAAPESHKTRPTIAYATGKAFTFFYQENFDLLEEAGGELAGFDPTKEESLPKGTDALIMGGGYPEVYLADIVQNKKLLSEIASFHIQGGPIWAECAGHMVLGSSIEQIETASVHPGRSTMSSRVTLGYRFVSTKKANPLFDSGSVFRAHEYHYSKMGNDGDDFQCLGRGGRTSSGVAGPSLISSYLHFHLGYEPNSANRYVSSALRFHEAKDSS